MNLDGEEGGSISLSGKETSRSGRGTESTLGAPNEERGYLEGKKNWVKGCNFVLSIMKGLRRSGKRKGKGKKAAVEEFH